MFDCLRKGAIMLETRKLVNGKLVNIYIFLRLNFLLKLELFRTLLKSLF